MHCCGRSSSTLPVEAPGRNHVYQMYTVKLKGVDRNRFLAELRAQGIGASVHFDPPVHTQPFYLEKYGSDKLDLPVTMNVSRTIVTLPIYPGMSEDDVSYVAETANAAAAKFRL